VRRLAAGQAQRGVGKGDVFAHYAANLPEYDAKCYRRIEARAP
jgi:hypothetical protein